MLLHTYIDDSADEKQEKIAVAGAFVGRFGEWSELKRQWRRRLQREGIEYFRSTEYYSLEGQFRKYRDPVKYPKPQGSRAAAQFRDDLDALVKRNHLAGFAVCVSLPGFWSLLEADSSAAQVFGESPFEVALQLLFRELSHSVEEQVGSGYRLAFVVDESSSAERIERTYLEFKRLNPGLAENMQGLSHLDDKKTPPLQVADMMANIAKEFFLKWSNNPVQAVPSRFEKKIGAVWLADRPFLELVLKSEKERRGIA